MEQKAKWIYIGESTDLFIKGKIYAEDNTPTQHNKTLKHVVEDGMGKIFIGEGGKRSLRGFHKWTTEFYKL